MRVLVTGAMGFLGVNLIRTLGSVDGLALVAADLQAPSERIVRFLDPVRSSVSFSCLDVTDRQAVSDLVTEMGITHIIHGAALTPTDEQERTQPTHVIDVNLVGSINLLDAAICSERVERMLLLSSSGLYAPSTGVAGSGCVKEESELSLDNLYAVTKYSAELLAARYSQICGKPIAAVRIGPCYGPMEQSSASRLRISRPGALFSALREDRPVTVAGPDIGRDWTYVADIARALLALLTAQRWNHAVYNVSSGMALLFREVVETFARHGLVATWVEDASTAEIAMSVAHERLPMDISRIKQDAGFVPRYDLQAGVAASIKMERS
jgi:nucleoside-diphosphate-sugar epimerase